MNNKNEPYKKDDGHTYCICRWCGEEFLLKHGNQRHCQKKLGERNRCKREHDQYQQQVKKKAIVDELLSKRNIEKERIATIKLLESFLRNKSSVKVTLKELLDKGYNNYQDADIIVDGKKIYIVGKIKIKVLEKNILEIYKD